MDVKNRFSFVYACCFQNNKPSKALIEKCGFTFEQEGSYPRRVIIAYDHSLEKITDIIVSTLNKFGMEYKIEAESVIYLTNGSSIKIEVLKSEGNSSIAINKHWKIPNLKKIMPFIKKGLEIKTEKSKLATAALALVGVIFFITGIAF